jgi:hypothetical protein
MVVGCELEDIKSYRLRIGVVGCIRQPSRVVDLLLTKNIYKEAANLKILRVMSLKDIDGCRL